MRIPGFAVRVIALPCLLFIPALTLASLGCPPGGWTAQRLLDLKARAFALEDNGARKKLALGLLDCLADADPAIRDGVAFEAYSSWLRADKLDSTTQLDAEQQLLPAIDPKAVDSDGFRQPFSALVLSELARADRKSPYLTPAQRQQLVEAAARYVESVRDYRGFDPREGWRHGVAHGSDLLMQLALNESLDKAQLDRILAAVKTQIAPAGEHFYIYGESERLARPVLFVALRGLHSPEEWNMWFQQVAAPAPLASWDQAFQSNAGLAQRHNTQAFLRVAYVEVSHSKNEALTKLLPAVTAALVAVP